MTREEAIEEINKAFEPAFANYIITALTEGVTVSDKALEQEPCEDAVSREAVLNGLASIAKAKAKSDAQKALMGRVMFFTEQLPPVTPKQKTGKWIITSFTDRYICSECGHNLITQYKPDNYCSYCGAKME